MARILNHGGPVSVEGRKLDGRRGHKPTEGSLPDALLEHPVIKAMLASGRLERLDAPAAETAADAPKPETKPKSKRKRGRKPKPKPEPEASAPAPESEPTPDLEPMDPAEE